MVWWDIGEEIYYNHSTDAGVSWQTFYTQLTNDPGRSEYSSVAASDSAVHVVWMDDRDGNWQVYYKRNPTGNLGVEEITPLRLTPYVSRLTAFPNPFTSYTTVPSHEADRFSLYDVSGRRVGVYKGDRIGEGLRAGVYFVRALEGEAGLVRVVKVR